MGKAKKKESISGWYAKEQLSQQERDAKMAAIEAWYEKRHTMNYRTVPLELPGKMLAALGKMGMDQGMQISEFIEGILGDYLKKKKVKWQ
jgi:hypothetical protein